MLVGTRLKVEMPIIIPEANPKETESTLFVISDREIDIKAPSPVTIPATSPNIKIRNICLDREYLLVVDELEEFSRMSRVNKNRQYVNEFCKTQISKDDSYFNVDFIFDNKDIENLDPERAFKDKCKK
jgi:hypothetical protein